MSLKVLIPFASWRAAGLCTVFLAAAACQPAGEDAVGNPIGTQISGTGQIIATVNGTPIYQSELDFAAVASGVIADGSSLSASDPIFADLRDELIDQRLLAEKAHRLGLDKMPSALMRIRTARERILGDLAVEDHLEKTVTEEAAQKLYKAQIALRDTSEEVRASHILAADEAAINVVQVRLEAGEAFSKVAFDVSQDEGSRLDGGDLGYFQRNTMVADFSKAVFALQTGETSAPFKTEFGWHIARVTGRRTAPVPSYEAMRDELMNYLTLDEIKNLIEGLESDATVERLTLPVQTPEPQDLPAENAADVEGEDDGNE